MSTRRDAPRPGEPALGEPALSVAALARRLGVAPATLRTWDRRYGVGPSGHTTGRHRRYGAEDIARLELMQRALLRGASPAEAARYALQATSQPPPLRATSQDPASQDPASQDLASQDRPSQGRSSRQPNPQAAQSLAARAQGAPARKTGRERAVRSPVRLAATTTGVSGLAVVGEAADTDPADAAGSGPAAAGLAGARPVTGMPGASPGFGSLVAEGDYRPAPGRRAASGGRGLKLPGASRAARGLGRAVLAMDSPGAQRLLADAFDYLGVPAAWAEVVAPVSAAILARWETSGLGVEIDHLLRECVLAALIRVTPVVSAPRNARPVLLACVPREPTSLPLYALVATLAEREIGTRMLGAALPADALATAIRRIAPAAVVLWAHAPRHADTRLPTKLPTNRVRCRLLLAGPGWRLAGAVEVDGAGPGARAGGADDHREPGAPLPEDLARAADEIERVAVGI